ncbi:MAG: hypothetical protein NZ529_03640 [Cytophagaceae bacterium]|nr:hypothetical protein [Cytophagaceae bacterium]MDW8455863.1 hypothetical protein [Cytophagaceae bacterium]
MTAGQNKLQKENYSTIEKIVVALMFILIIANYILYNKTDEFNQLTMSALQLVLLGYYISVFKKNMLLFFIGFIIIVLGTMLKAIQFPGGVVLKFCGMIIQFSFGLYLGIKAVKRSMKNKDIEIFSFLLCLVMAYPLIHFIFLKPYKEFLTVYHFATSFIVLYIMNYENLWGNYTAAEKKVIFYVLIVALLQVLINSLQYLN